METKTIKLFTVDPNNSYGNPANAWTPITLNHPATFDTVVMDTELKQMIIEDLERFLKRKEYYRHVGKVWKRGYLLYGPPGTGKSSLIAAMANYLNFDVYDLALSGLRFDSELRNALLGTANKSIVVVEDIDCSIELNNRENEEGPCGFDGRFPGGQRQQDKACSFPLIDEIDHNTLRGWWRKKNVTPAEVAEQLMKHDKPDPALRGLVEFLELKKVDEANEEAKKLKDDESKLKETDNKNDEVNDGEDVKEANDKESIEKQDVNK
uniref:ATPase AAA-type core domain-containing protein n=1 Tax=Chenopodium quinoa TaxID=63459 RepID=A0A803L6W5_CHEQI